MAGIVDIRADPNLGRQTAPLFNATQGEKKK